MMDFITGQLVQAISSHPLPNEVNHSTSVSSPGSSVPATPSFPSTAQVGHGCALLETLLSKWRKGSSGSDLMTRIVSKSSAGKFTW